MASTLYCVNIHYVFSTKKRLNLIDNEIRERLWAFMGGIARKNNILTRAIGGTENHAHLLISITPPMNIAKVIQLIKGGSSKWINQEFKRKSSFAWQRGYAAISVSPDRIDQIIHYIRNQEKHHFKMTFEKEYLKFIRESGIPYDEKYIWD